MFHPIVAATGAGAVNLPIVIVGVFAATFFLVCAIAYLFLGRSSSSAERSGPAVDIASPELQPSFEPPASVETSFGVVQPALPQESIDTGPAAAPDGDRGPSIVPAAPAPKKSPLLTLYRVLMFATGGTGLLAAYLMFSSVEGFSRLLVMSIVVAILSLLALYRGFVPDPELNK